MKENKEIKKELNKQKENHQQNKNNQEKVQLQNKEKKAKKIKKDVNSNKNKEYNNKSKELEGNKKKEIESVKKKLNNKLEREKKNKIKRKKRKIILILIAILMLLFLSLSFIYIVKEEREEKLRLDTLKREKELVNEINSHYNEYVKTNKEAIIYNENEEEIGKIANNIELSLEETEINKETIYFKVKDFENSYIRYEDVEVIDKLNEFNTRYKNYVVFNQNIVTNNITTFYDENNNLIYQFNTSFDLPIIIKDNDKYGILFNNRLLYVKQDDVFTLKDNVNTDLEVANSIRVIAYHAFYDKNDETEAWCRNSICHSTEQIESHAKYISENNYFTLTMKELEMYIDGKINFPKKSVVITIDDGLLAERGIEILNNYKLNATVFLITSYYTPSSYIDYEYIEYHSHGHNIHNVGQCPGGQGGGIKCLEESKLLEDLKTSSELLNDSTVFCYPFYEYNNYAIQTLKKAGYTMAFAGLLNDGRVHVGTNKYLIPRYTIYNNTTVNQLANIIR